MDTREELGAPGASHLGSKHTDGFTFRKGLGWERHVLFLLSNMEIIASNLARRIKQKSDKIVGHACRRHTYPGGQCQGRARRVSRVAGQRNMGTGSGRSTFHPYQ